MLPGPAVAGGLAVLGGVALRRLGMEFERAWLRSEDNVPVVGDTFVGDRGGVPQSARIGEEIPAVGERRRWVAQQSLRGGPRPARLACSGPGEAGTARLHECFPCRRAS